MLEINTEEGFNSKLSMFLKELNNLEFRGMIKSKIIDNLLTSLKESPLESYPKCFKDQYYQAGGVGYKRSYEKRC
ncbi:MAG: hypothetical protein EKK61_06040 [Rickettsiales bacterium]|nr:MAG: hypothetical protein EKK61_06040 [Rickettsiales bacterium]